MTHDLHSLVDNDLVEDAHSVWCLKGHDDFGYSDGRSSEKYLHRVFSDASDLGTRSAELEGHIKDWPSEYHLTSKRAQLLSGFNFDRQQTVLEVGCGCGAITRFLGETFERVISVEGSIHRARLARLRCRDLDSVSIICSPFQEIRFEQKFDIIFCIGVLEYSASFIDAEDPYDAALAYFSEMLTPDGCVVVAIENQFGLKYFNCAHEDHLGVMFEGVQGYHRQLGQVRTFGKPELEKMLKKYFPKVEFFYPYPDYKIPECVISETFLASGRPAELLSQMRSRNYSGQAPVLWDESTTVLELARNRMLDFFANSFLVFAARGDMQNVSFAQQAVMYSSGRKPAFSTRTNIVEIDGEALVVEKYRLQPDADDGADGWIRLANVSSPWIDAFSLHTLVYLRARAEEASIEDVFRPCIAWAELLMSRATLRDGVQMLPGSHVDSLWSNAYPVDGEIRLVDREWILQQDIRLNVVVIRAIYDFLCRVETLRPVLPAPRTMSGKKCIREISAQLGISLGNEDFDEFVSFESKLACMISGASSSRQNLFIRWFLLNRPSRRWFRLLLPIARDYASRLQARLQNLL